MKKIVFLVLLVIVLSCAFAAETLAKKGKKARRSAAGRFVERCRAVTRGGKVVYSERCGKRAAAPRRGRAGRRFVEKCRKVTKTGKVIYSESCRRRRTRRVRVIKKRRSVVKCWRFRSGKKGKRVARKCRRCTRGKKRNSRKLRRRLAAWRRKHRGLKKIWYYLAQLEKKLVSQRSSLETVSKRKHTKYLTLVKKVETLKKSFETAKAEYEKLKKAVDAKESGFEQLVEKLKTFEISFNKIRATYIKHVRIAERLYARYQKTLSSKRYLRLQAELRVLSICKTKMRWLSHLIKKYVRVKTVHHKEYVFLYRKRKVLVDGKCVCPVVLRPVCGKDGVTYSSRCVARCAGAKFDYRGVCKCTPSKPVPPKTTTPKTSKPKTTKPKTTKPKTNKPKTNKPKTTKPKTNKPKTTKPKTTKPKTNKPKTNKPKTNKPRTNKPKTNKPKTQKPKEKIEEVKCTRVNKGGKIVEACA